MSEALQWGGDEFPKGDRELWEEQYMKGREVVEPVFASDDDLEGDPPGRLGHTERVDELEAAERKEIRRYWETGLPPEADVRDTI